MTVSLKNGKPATKEALQALETAIGTRLSDAFKAFVSTQDGARPESNLLKNDGTASWNVNRFIPIEEIIKARSDMENISSHAYPFAEDSCGNYFLIDEM